MPQFFKGIRFLEPLSKFTIPKFDKGKKGRAVDLERGATLKGDTQWHYLLNKRS